MSIASGTDKPARSHVSKRILFIAALSCAYTATAQDANFVSRSRLVQVPVTITDPTGRPVAGLQLSDFQLFDEGRAQKISVDTIDTGVAPIALVIAIQSSGISFAALDKVRKIAALIRPMVTGERGCAAVLSFADSVTWLQECTNDPDILNNTLRQLRPGAAKQAHMIDAVQASVEHLRAKADWRRILFLVSESKDRGSKSDLASAVTAAQTGGVMVYAATYSTMTTAFTSKEPSGLPGLPEPVTAVPNPQRTVDGGNSNPFHPKLVPMKDSLDAVTAIGEIARLGKVDTARVLTAATGGATLPFTRQSGLESAIQKLGAELHNQYVISFAPDPAVAGYHHLEVRLTRPEDYRIRARPGYSWGEQLP